MTDTTVKKIDSTHTPRGWISFCHKNETKRG